MGGDFAPKAPIAGALLALQELEDRHTVQLVGQTAVIESQLADLLAGELSSASSVRKRVQIVEAPDVIEMSEKPAHPFGIAGGGAPWNDGSACGSSARG